MRRLLMFVLMLAAAGSSFAQILQASIGAGSLPTSVRIYVRPDVLANGNISTMNFNVAIPASTPGPTPTLTIINNPFPGAGFQILTPYVEDGYIHYNIANLNNFAINIAGGVETLMLEVRFDLNPVNSANVSLVTLPDGGIITPFALFLSSGVAGVNGSALYYTRAGTTVTNGPSYNYPSFSPPGTFTSTATMSTLTILPITWLSFDAVKQGNDGILNWTVSNEESNKHFVVQRSMNGTSFTTIGTVNKTGSGVGVKNYTFKDQGISSLGSNIIYYRIQQVDIDSRTTLSETRFLKLNNNKGEITIFPNPVTEGFYVNVPVDGTDKSIVKLNLVTFSGQMVMSKEITAMQASNYYFDIKGKSLAAGQYSLQVIHDGKILATKKLLINQ